MKVNHEINHRKLIVEKELYIGSIFYARNFSSPSFVIVKNLITIITIEGTNQNFCRFSVVYCKYNSHTYIVLVGLKNIMVNYSIAYKNINKK